MTVILIAALSSGAGEKTEEDLVQEAEEKRKGYHCLNKRDGRHYGLEVLIQRELKDPGSLKIMDTLIGPVEDGHHEIHVEYRAKNSFGAMVDGYAVGSINTVTCNAELLASQ